MRLSAFGREISAGLIVGLSAVIYALSYGALLFSGPLAPFVGFGVTIALITAVVGALLAWFSQERLFIAGPDSNTISVLASILAVIAAQGVTSPDLAVAMIFTTGALSAVAFFVVARARLATLVRYIPFSVMAGFLASTGWLMSSGALNIIAAAPLTASGLEKFLADPAKPELAFGVAIAVILLSLARRVSSAILIPAVMILATIAVNLFLTSGVCDTCSRDAWMFSRLDAVAWSPPWQLAVSVRTFDTLAENLPAMLVVCFVGLLTVLISVASLELNFEREFDLDKILKVHAAGSAVATVLGGFSPIISIGRTMLNKQVGGSALAGGVAAGMCLAMLFGAGAALAYVPKAALGGLVLFLGVGMLKQWLWDQRRARPMELAQIVLIVALVANYGFLVGFSAGLVISCVIFVVSYSRIPLADLATDLSVFASSVARPEQELEVLRAHGAGTLLYRLSGYVFFGSASKIDAVFQTLGPHIEGVVIDFTNVSGVDRSAVGVFQRVLRRHLSGTVHFYLVYGGETQERVRAIAEPFAGSGRLHLESSLDHAVETAEDAILARRTVPPTIALAFLENSTDRALFLQYCELAHVRQGQTLCAEGDRSGEIYFIESGSLEVVKASDRPAPIRLAKLNKGAMVGELAFYTGAPRTASIVAVTDSSVYVLREAALATLRTHHPALATTFDHMVIHKLSNALARASTLVATFQ